MRFKIALGILPAVLIAVNSCFISSCAHVIPSNVSQTEHCQNRGPADGNKGGEHQTDCCLKKAAATDNYTLLVPAVALPVPFGLHPEQAQASELPRSTAVLFPTPPGPALHKIHSVFLI